MEESLLFNSFEFIFLFLPIVFFGYFYLNRNKFIIAGKVWLVISSLVFYSYWNIKYLPLLLISIAFNFSVGSILSAEKFQKHLRFSRKTVLNVSIVINIVLLSYYKYSGFIIESINDAFNLRYALPEVLLPLGISFFTFTQIAYLVDSYRGTVKEYDFINYTLFVTFFPHLIAGPILHHREMMTQFESRWTWIIRYRNIANGIFIFSIGLFKKVVIADYFSIWVIKGFDEAQTLSFFEAWVTSLSYTFQLYFDFSGYSDMAIGSALLFNIKLPINFDSPYKAINIQDFWRRWHITLSRFLKDYVYIPFGGNRRGTCRTFGNLLATFVIGGIWHGAGWTFVFWGGLHGFALVIHRIWQLLGVKLNVHVSWFLTFNFVNISWVFFRAHNWNDAIKVLKSMFDFNNIAISLKAANTLNHINPLSDIIIFNGSKVQIFFNAHTVEFILAGFVLIFLKSSSDILRSLSKDKFSYNVKHALMTSFLLFCSFLTSFFGSSIQAEFLYFNF